MSEINVTEKSPVRINVYLRNEGYGSRREIDNYISKKYVKINGVVATLGSKVKNGDKVSLIQENKKLTYALYYKPRGEITGRKNEIPLCEPIGRLDKESEGLLLYTNDYRVVDALLNPKHKREKEYAVEVRERATPRVITLLKMGIRTQEGTYSPVRSVSIYNEGHLIKITLTEGKKHEIRRMLNALNLTIISLKRVRIMSFTVHGLKSGQIHILSSRQIETLFKDCEIK